MFKRKPINKKFDQADEESSEDCSVVFNLNNEDLSISIGWNEDFDLDRLAELLVPMTNGQLVAIIFEYLEKTQSEEDVNTLKALFENKLSETVVTGNDEEPFIQPLNAMNYLKNMNNMGEE